MPIRRKDILQIKSWRNEQMNILRQKRKLTDLDQILYFKKVISKLYDADQPTQILFSYFHMKKLIGYGGLVHIAWADKRAEVSFLVETRRSKDSNTYKIDFSSYLTLLKQVAFDDLDLNRIYTETFDIRETHVSILEESGFKLEGVMKEHVLIDEKFVDSLIHAYLRKYYDVQG